MVVWEAARLHAERVSAVVGVSVPFTPWPARPTDIMKAMWTDRFFYILYFQQVGPPEKELEADVRRTMHNILWGASGEMYKGMPSEFPPMEGTGFLDMFTDIPERLPDWLTKADLDHYVKQFENSGFFGPVSWYRNLDANYEIIKDLSPDLVTMPSYFIGGEKDGVIAGRPEYVDGMNGLLPNYRGKTMIPGAGHWTTQRYSAFLRLCDALATKTLRPHQRLVSSGRRPVVILGVGPPFKGIGVVSRSVNMRHQRSTVVAPNPPPLQSNEESTDKPQAVEKGI
jgi:pimeloyl-ACP methyl ester carboxylesterase